VIRKGVTAKMTTKNTSKMATKRHKKHTKKDLTNEGHLLITA
jgi:hypothetical protein